MSKRRVYVIWTKGEGRPYFDAAFTTKAAAQSILRTHASDTEEIKAFPLYSKAEQFRDDQGDHAETKAQLAERIIRSGVPTSVLLQVQSWVGSDVKRYVIRCIEHIQKAEREVAGMRFPHEGARRDVMGRMLDKALGLADKPSMVGMASSSEWFVHAYCTQKGKR